MGGRAAEEIALNSMTTGAGNDIERATEMARHMVTEWGMSSLGPLSLGNVEQEMFLGREISKRVDYSEMTAQKIDAEVKNIVMEGYNRARNAIDQNRDKLEKLAQRLLEKEVVDSVELDSILGKEAA